MPTTQPEAKRFYRPELDALRFGAFLLVFICHVLQDAGLDSVLGVSSPLVRAVGGWLALISEVGAFGVSLFFVLSAYLITELMLLEHSRTGQFRVKDFYIRRILRIWPLYFATIGLFVVLGWINPQEFHTGAMRIFAFLALSGNWYLIFRGTFPAQLGVLWSVSIEEQFYLLWPGIFVQGKRRGIVFGCITFALVGVATLSYLGIAGVDRTGAWMNSLVQFLFFAIGGGLALVMHRRVPQTGIAARLALASGGLAIWFVAEAMTHIQQRDAIVHSGGLLLGYAGVAVGTTAIFLAALGIRAERIPNWSRYLGKISYGLYVFHPLVVWATVLSMSRLAHAVHLHGLGLVASKLALPLVALGLTIACAAASYRWLESPFLRLRKRFTIVASRPV